MGIFNYESKFMQLMLLVADYMILNLVYIICCLPVFTIGAAQAGLYAGIRQLLNKDDDTPALRCFFKGFASGFGNITIVWTLFTVVIAALVYCCLLVMGFEFVGFKPQLWMIILALAICMIYQANLTIFHSNFGCTKLQLIRNVFFVTLAHPLRSIVVAVLTWLPAIVFVSISPVFMAMTPVLFACYFSISFLISTLLMKKPFKTLADNFMQAQQPAEELPEESEEA